MSIQAVVMAAGKGSRIMEITSNMPKCLIPVGNVPIIKCCLHALKAAGINDIIILVPESERLKIQEALEKHSIKADLVSVPKNEDWGTADSLRYIKDKIHSDVIVVSCDLVTNFNFKKLVIFHQKYDSSLTILLSPLSKTMKDLSVPGHKGKHKQEKDIIGMDDNGRLIFFNSEADFEDGVPVKLLTMTQHPVIKVRSDLLDSHLYVMKKSLVDFVASNKNLSTLKGEFLPVIVSAQFNKKYVVDQTDSKTGPSNLIIDPDTMDLKKLALELSSWNINAEYLRESYLNEPLKCFAYVDNENFCMRVNNLVAYADANKQILPNIESVMGISRKPSQFPKSQVDPGSVVGEECELLVKSSVKQSIIGDHCHLNEKTKIANSVLMDNVAIGAGSVVQNSIICNNVRIGSGCELKNCVVGSDQVINDGTKLSNEVVQRAYELLDI